MQLGAANFVEILSALNSCPKPVGNADYDAWAAQLAKLEAEAAAFTSNMTKNTRTRKYYFMRAEIFRQLAREPITRCRIDVQKAGRKISDIMAINEIRKPWITTANEWTDRATKAERMQQIEIAAVVITVATAGAAAIAAAAGASTAGATVTGAVKAAAASALGINAPAGASLKQIGMAALKKLAIEKGTEAAVEVAGEEYAKYQGKKIAKAQEKAIAIELAAAEKEYAELIARGKSPGDALQTASAKGGGGGIIPVGLIALAAKLLMK